MRFIKQKLANLHFLFFPVNVMIPLILCVHWSFVMWPEYIMWPNSPPPPHTHIPKAQIVDFSTTITVTAVKHSLQHHYTHTHILTSFQHNKAHTDVNSNSMTSSGTPVRCALFHSLIQRNLHHTLKLLICEHPENLFSQNNHQITAGYGRRWVSVGHCGLWGQGCPPGLEGLRKVLLGKVMVSFLAA